MECHSERVDFWVDFRNDGQKANILFQRRNGVDFLLILSNVDGGR